MKIKENKENEDEGRLKKMKMVIKRGENEDE